MPLFSRNSAIFNGKSVLLTGAASGIGRELALQLASNGCSLYLVDIDRRRLENLACELSSRCEVLTRVCDLSRASSVDQMLSDFDRRVGILDILINNAGVAYYGPTQAMEMAQWDWLLNINLNSPIRITQHFISMLAERPRAHIVNMCSIAGLVAAGRTVAYHTSKFGLVGFTEAIRAEYGRKGVGVTAVCPGPVQTRLYENMASGRTDSTVPMPPAWTCASTKTVAKKTLRAIENNRRQILITPMAHSLYFLKRLCPGLLDAANQFSRKKRRRLAELQRREDLRVFHHENEQARRVA